MMTNIKNIFKNVVLDLNCRLETYLEWRCSFQEITMQYINMVYNYESVVLDYNCVYNYV